MLRFKNCQHSMQTFIVEDLPVEPHGSILTSSRKHALPAVRSVAGHVLSTHTFKERARGSQVYTATQKISFSSCACRTAAQQARSCIVSPVHQFLLPLQLLYMCGACAQALEWLLSAQ